MRRLKLIDRYRRYFRFVRFSLGLDEGKEFLTGSEALEGFDWDDFWRFAKRQTLTGVVFEGIQRLPKECAPRLELLMAWMGQSQQIRRQNWQLNEATAYIYNKVRAEGLRCCILKGQGNALMYPTTHSRTPGDVDVWVNASREEIRRLAYSLAKDNGSIGEESLNHIELTVRGVAVELHPTPMIFNNPVMDRRMQRWFVRNADLQCSNLVDLPDGMGRIAVPTAAFNVIYQLSHLHHHFFYEGVGLRQVVDYYFVIHNAECIIHNDSLRIELKRLGLWKFVGAVMYVLHEVLGLSEIKMIAPMDEERGRLLLDEILEGGNFGQFSNRQHYGRGTLGHNIQRIRRDLQLMRYYPAEALAEPFFRLWHFFWRMKNK